LNHWFLGEGEAIGKNDLPGVEKPIDAEEPSWHIDHTHGIQR
jgi:hypothetical protein